MNNSELICCGIEIHAQLEGTKLFCACPTKIRDDQPQTVIKRFMRTAAGELGDVDVAARKEVEKGKYSLYQAYQNSTCLVEIDESPPYPLSTYALHAGIQVAKILGMQVVDQLQVMRKTIVDGSATSGFQRTALLSMNGKLNTSKGVVRIKAVCIEEDACKIINQEKDHTLYSLDRLGIPLLEIATEADITSPEQCAETAEKIGLIVKSTGVAKRGLGTIRQDVNVSIPEGDRVEIKGAQDLAIVPLLVAYEAQRQRGLLAIAQELKKRGMHEVKSFFIDTSTIFSDTECKIITETIKNKGTILGVKLEGFAGLLGKELQPNRRFGSELSDYAKIYAGIGGIFHSDELPKYGINAQELERLKKTLFCTEQDGFVLVVAGREKAKHALQIVVERANNALKGIVREVRKANPDGTTSFLRPLPGAARMYPETDVQPITLTRQLVESITIPELIETRTERYATLGLSSDLATLAAKSEHWKEFDKLVAQFKNLKIAYLAEIFFTAEKTIERQFKIKMKKNSQDYSDLFNALNNQDISKESVLEILKQEKTVAEVLSKYKVLSDAELEAEIKTIAEENKGVQFTALIGKAMQRLRGKASGEKIAGKLKILFQA